MSNRTNCEAWKCDGFSEDHLFAIVDHADSQIKEWTRRRDIAIGHLAARGFIVEEYPIGGDV